MIDDLNYITMLGSRKKIPVDGGRRDNCVCRGDVLGLFLINLQWELHEFDFLGKGDPDPNPPLYPSKITNIDFN